jgi:predicted amidohydrolase YtcJ
MTYPLASLTRAGVTVVAGSDGPIDPIQPLTCIGAALERPGTKEAISAEETIALYTRNAAYASFEEKKKGTITPGKYADLIALQDDPTTANADAIANIKVVLTMVGGRIVYQTKAH